MKIAGKTFGPNMCTVVIPRDGGNAVFKAKAVLDFEDFESLCPQPTPPEVLVPGKPKSLDVEDPKYKELIQAWSGKRLHWLVMKSLEATEGLTWETVNPSDPETWGNISDEFKDAGFSPMEVSRIMDCVFDACGLNSAKIEKATADFLAGQGKE